MLLFLVKFLHSLIIIYLFLCLYLLWDYALAGVHRRWLGLAVASILLEGMVFAASGFVCPLTTLAIELGDSTGTDYLSEMLYLERLNYLENYALFAAAGLGLAGRRYLKHELRDRKPKFETNP